MYLLKKLDFDATEKYFNNLSKKNRWKLMQKKNLTIGFCGFSARKKDKGGNGMMAGLMMMKGTLGALGFGALAMLAGKALMTGLMALMLSAIVGLKHLAGGEKKTTYEIVSKPVYASAHAHSSEEHHGGYMSAGYARAMNDDTAGLVREAIKSYANVRQRRMAWWRGDAGV